MTKNEIAARLIKENIPTATFSLEGGLPEDKYCLGETHDGWEVYYSERGSRWDVKRFSSEEEACEYLYERLVKMMKHM